MRNFILALFCLFTYQAQAQFADSLRLAVGTTATAASQGYQPLWLSANRYGTIADRQFDASTYVRMRNTHVLGRRPLPDSAGQVAAKRGFYLGYGVALYNNSHFSNTFLEQGYAQVGYRWLRLRAGRYQEVTGEIDPTLSSGSLGISGNALPVPKIDLAVVEYTPVPFTHGWVQFKGQFAHGWLGDAEGITGVYLHQKSLYLRVGKKRLSFYGGLTHFAQWGGNFPSGPAPSRFSDYLRIVVGASGNAADPVYQQGPIDVANAVGNHILIPDFGFTFRTNATTLRLYTQTIFDKGVGDSTNANQRDRLDGLKILSRDRLVGFSWETTKRGFLQKILLEGLYTKYQGGPAFYAGRDNYYNNATYLMGWQYQNRIIGTPLFINSQAAQDYGIPFGAGGTIVSNRLIGIHLGAKGNLASHLAYRLLATHVQHYGNYYNTPDFTPAKKETHLLLELPYQFAHFCVTVAAAGDFGDLTNNVGGLLRCEWQLR